MERTFAGFWVDGAVRKPEEHHWDMDRTVLAKHKMDGTFDICRIGYSGWERVYWLDTTTPTELTPQQAFEVYKIVYPEARRIERASDGWTVDCGMKNTTINWNGTTEYPPRERWRVPTDADKGRRCRFKTSDRDWDATDSDPDFQGLFLCRGLKDGFVVDFDGEIQLSDCCEVLE